MVNWRASINQYQSIHTWRVAYGFEQSGTANGSFSGYRISYKLKTDMKFDN